MPLTINGETVPEGAIEAEFQAIKADYERLGRVSCCERDGEFRGYARENVTGRVLLRQEARRREPEVPAAEVDAALARLIEANGGRAAFFAHAGISPEDEPLVRGEVEDGLRVDRLLESLWAGRPEPTDDDLRAWHEAHASEFLTPEEVRASHLFREVRKVEDRPRVYDELRDIRRRALAGEDFDTLAAAHTDKEDKLVDLGFFRRGEFMEEFDAIVFSLETGEVSPVFPSQWGFHLAKVTARRPPAPRSFDDVRNDVRDRFIAEFRQQRTAELVDTLKAAADIRDETDTPATPVHEH